MGRFGRYRSRFCRALCLARIDGPTRFSHPHCPFLRLALRFRATKRGLGKRETQASRHPRPGRGARSAQDGDRRAGAARSLPSAAIAAIPSPPRPTSSRRRRHHLGAGRHRHRQGGAGRGRPEDRAAACSATCRPIPIRAWRRSPSATCFRCRRDWSAPPAPTTGAGCPAATGCARRSPSPSSTSPAGSMLYSTGSTHLLSAILTRASGRSTLRTRPRLAGAARRGSRSPTGSAIRKASISAAIRWR